MERSGTFNYNYSASRNREVERIRNKYVDKETNKLDTLRALDKKVKDAGTAESLSIGTVGCLIFGIAMCFGLHVLEGAVWLPYLLGALGTAIMLTSYPVYLHIVKKTRAKLVPQILQLSDEILNNDQNS